MSVDVLFRVTVELSKAEQDALSAAAVQGSALHKVLALDAFPAVVVDIARLSDNDAAVDVVGNVRQLVAGDEETLLAVLDRLAFAPVSGDREELVLALQVVMALLPDVGVVDIVVDA
jgi:hypothetical protein